MRETNAIGELSGIRQNIHRIITYLTVLIAEGAIALIGYAAYQFKVGEGNFGEDRIWWAVLASTMALVAVVGCFIVFSSRKGFTLPLEAASKLAEAGHTSIQLLLSSLDVLHEGFVQTDRTGRVIHINAPMEQLTGVDEEHILSQPISTVFDVIYGEKRRRAGDMIEEVVRSGSSINTGPFAEIIPLSAKRFIGSVAVAPVFDTRGVVDGVSIAIRPQLQTDTLTVGKPQTEKQPEPVLQSETSADPFDLRGKMIIDSNGHVMECDEGASRIFGYAVDEIIGRSADDLIKFKRSQTNSNGVGVRSFIQICGALPMGDIVDVTTVRSDSQTSFCELVAEPIGNENQSFFAAQAQPAFTLHIRPSLSGQYIEAANALHGQIETLREDLKGARSALECAEMAHSMLLADISEDLRTPLDVVIGYSELLQDDASDQGLEQFVRDLRKVEKSGKRLLTLANNMMHLSLMQAGKVDLYLHAFELSMFAREVVKAIQPQLDARGSEIEIEYHHRPGHEPRPIADAGTIQADRTKLLLALMNIMTNAIQGTSGKAMKLQIERDFDPIASSEWVKFSVSTAPRHYDSEDAQRLLDNVRDMDDMVMSTGTGSALEMEISGRFCQMMGGEFSIDRQPGEETRYTVRIPAIVSDPKAMQSVAFGTRVAF